MLIFVDVGSSEDLEMAEVDTGSVVTNDFQIDFAGIVPVIDYIALEEDDQVIILSSVGMVVGSIITSI